MNGCIRCGGVNKARGIQGDWWECKACGLMVKPNGILGKADTLWYGEIGDVLNYGWTWSKVPDGCLFIAKDDEG